MGGSLEGNEILNITLLSAYFYLLIGEFCFFFLAFLPTSLFPYFSVSFYPEK